MPNRTTVLVPCCACKRRIEPDDARWELRRRGSLMREFWLCADCAEVEIDDLLLTALRTATYLSLAIL